MKTQILSWRLNFHWAPFWNYFAAIRSIFFVFLSPFRTFPISNNSLKPLWTKNSKIETKRKFYKNHSFIFGVEILAQLFPLS
jgi:hypothetical protein